MRAAGGVATIDPMSQTRPKLGARLRALFEVQRTETATVPETPKAAEGMADRAEKKVEETVVRQGKLRRAWSDIQLLVRLVRAWARGEYRDVSRTTMALVIGALAYFLTPLDAIFDHL